MNRVLGFRCFTLLLFAALIVGAQPLLNAAEVATSPRTLVSLDADWRFHQGDAPGAERPAFDDTGWRALDVPHDWAIEGPFDPQAPAGGAGAFLPAGVGWYRRTLVVPATAAGRRVFVEFDGVMANSDVWINGVHLGHRPSGYLGFRYDITEHITLGPERPNTLAVRADNAQQPASRWYAGAGIYRHVRLLVTSPVQVEPHATFVRASDVTAERAVVRVESRVANLTSTTARVGLRIVLRDPEGRAVATKDLDAQPIPAGESVAFQHEVVLERPMRWDLATPQLYRAIVTVRGPGAGASGGIARDLDEEHVNFGIRDARFEADTGFWLNGRNLKLKGVCLHEDGGALGRAVPLGLWEQRLEMLRAVGVNAIRVGHHAFAPGFYDLCDRRGFLVVNELFDVWTGAKEPFDYHLHFGEWGFRDLADFVRRDRNHPSIIIWSAGNEIRDTTRSETAKTTLASLVETFHRLDPSRPVTQALFRPNVSKDYENGLADLLDVVGQNYREKELIAAHEQKPSRKILGTENGHERRQWLVLRDYAAFAGQFLWTGFDYLGEAGRWPAIATPFGLFDRTGAPYPKAFERQSWWSDAPMVHATRRIAATEATPTDPGWEPDLRHRQVLFSDWTPRESGPHVEKVEVYSNAAEVELTLNGRSLGTKPRPGDASPRLWSVPYEPGVLRATARDAGVVVSVHELRTAGAPARIELRANRPALPVGWDEVATLTATVVDADGVPVPRAAVPVTFSAEGAGAVVAVDSGDNASHESFRGAVRNTYQGRCVALVKATQPAGKITVRASAPGLDGDVLTLSVPIQAAPPTPAP